MRILVTQEIIIKLVKPINDLNNPLMVYSMNPLDVSGDIHAIQKEVIVFGPASRSLNP